MLWQADRSAAQAASSSVTGALWCTERKHSGGCPDQPVKVLQIVAVPEHRGSQGVVDPGNPSWPISRCGQRAAQASGLHAIVTLMVVRLPSDHAPPFILPGNPYL